MPSSMSKGKKKQCEEGTCCEIGKQILNSCLADQFSDPAVQHMDVARQFTPLTETWALCNNLADERVYQEIQQVAPILEENVKRTMIPVPSVEVVSILNQLCWPDVQEFLKKLMHHFSEGACSHQGNECFENVQPTYTQLDTVFENPISTTCTPLPNITSSGQEDSQSNMQVKLLEAYDLTVLKDGLRKAISAAKKSQKPGYTLCYRLLPEVFSIETLANSRGQGILSAKESDLRPCLDKTKVCAIKDYVVVWCKKNGHSTPLEPCLNDAVTERISYVRKQIKMALKKHKND